MTSDNLTLSPDELYKLTGCVQQAAQLRELHRQGFWRARRLPTSGDLVLERAHYEAVCAGQTAPGKRRAEPEAKLRFQLEGSR